MGPTGPGGGPPTDGFTPGYTGSTTTFDVPDFGLNQPPFWRDLKGMQITGGQDLSALGQIGVSFHKGIGWRLDTIHRQMQGVHEQGAANNLTIFPSPQSGPASTIPAGFLSIPLYTPNTSTGVNPIASAVLGDYFLQKAVDVVNHPDWSSTQYVNQADQTAHPSPAVSGTFPQGDLEIVPLDRVGVGPNNHQPNQSLNLRIWIPELGAGASIGAIARIYFTGISGASSANTNTWGNGQYALTLMADGQAFLWEHSYTGAAANLWLLRKQFHWAPPHKIANEWHRLAITSDAAQDNLGNWHGSTISFLPQDNQEYQASALALAIGQAHQPNETQYYIPQAAQVPMTPAPARMDIRRDICCLSSYAYDTFIATGTLVTQTVRVPIDMGVVGGTDDALFATWLGAFPKSGLASLNMFSVDGAGVSTACVAATGINTDATSTMAGTFIAQGFTRNTDSTTGLPAQSYYATITLIADSTGLLSPTINRMFFVRNGAGSFGQPIPFTVRYKTAFSKTGGGSDPQTETGRIELNDYEDVLTALKTRGGMSVRHEINVPTTANPNQTSTLFVGKVSQAARFRRGVGPRRLNSPVNPASGLAQWPAPHWCSYIITCMGLWLRLAQAKTTQTFNFSQDTGSVGGLPYKATDAISLLLANAGLPNQMLDIPSSDIRLLVARSDDSNDAYRCEVYSIIMDWVLGFARDYVAGRIVYDANATNGGGSTDKYGCIRLKFAQRPASDGTYSPVLANFVQGPDWNDGKIRSNMNLNSYGGNMIGLQFVKNVPIRSRTLKEWVEPPEANAVYVTGTAATSGAQGGTLQAHAGTGNQSLIQVLHNWPAAHFFDGQPIPADPSNPDYTDGSPNIAILVDPGLTTQEGVDLVARRLFDFGCHARNHMTFEAPLVLVWDVSDGLQIRPRHLLYGDCVTFNDQYWFVGNVSIDQGGVRGGVRNSTAIYDLFQVPALMNPESTVDYHTVYVQGQNYSGALAEVS